MATINVSISVTKTVSTLDATTIAAVILWVKTNVVDKLPSDCTLEIRYAEVP